MKSASEEDEEVLAIQRAVAALSNTAECAKCGDRRPKDAFCDEQWNMKAARQCKACVKAAPHIELAIEPIELAIAALANTAECAMCGERYPKGAFSDQQWDMKAARRCKTCAESDSQVPLLAEVIEPASIVSANMAECAKCGQQLTKDAFSKRQWGIKAGRQCKTCVDSVPDGRKPTLQQIKTDVSKLSFEQLAAFEYFKPAERIETWWKQYREAFQKEHEWFEARGQPTSRVMGKDAQSMVQLVFNDETVGFKRVCFFARRSADVAACAFATVDVDPNPEQPCIVRMVLVAPDSQRQGVGLELLKTVVAHFGKVKRHLGLKYARCHDYEALYTKAGFTKMGADDDYVYMVRRVIVRGARR